jgi:GT2 family glycosyltransferase
MLCTVIIPTLEMALPITDHLIDEIEKNSSSVSKVLIINNREIDSFTERYKGKNKVSVIHDLPNLYVNAAWNYGMTLVDSKYYLLLNDDLLFKGKIIDDIVSLLETKDDLNLFTIETVRLFLGVAPNYKQIMSSFENEPYNTFKYERRKYPEMRQGWFMLARTKTWESIDTIKFGPVMHGDDVIHQRNQENYGDLSLVTSNVLYHCESTTVNTYLEKRNVIDSISKK